MIYWKVTLKQVPPGEAWRFTCQADEVVPGRGIMGWLEGGEKIIIPWHNILYLVELQEEEAPNWARIKTTKWNG